MTAPTRAWRQTSRQLVAYAVIGGIQLCADWGAFVALTWAGMGVVPANLCARVCGAVLGFWLNGRFTFAASSRGRLNAAHATKFLAFWLLMSLFSTGGVWLVEQAAGLNGARLAKPFIDAALAGLGFLASKFWIYR